MRCSVQWYNLKQSLSINLYEVGHFLSQMVLCDDLFSYCDYRTYKKEQSNPPGSILDVVLYPV